MPSLIVPWSITGIIFILLIIIFLNPEKAQIWSSWVAKWFASTNNFFARRTISGKIEGTVNQFSKTFDKESPGIMPYSLKIEWVRDIDKDALLQQEGIVVVRLGYHHEDLEKALALSMLTFCSKALIPISRPYLSKNLLRSVDLITTKKMLSQSNAKGSVDYLLSDIMRPEMDIDSELANKCKVVEILDERGLLSRVLLRELQELGHNLYPNTPDELSVIESEEFLAFLAQIANKAHDEDVDLSFTKSWIRVAFLLVARPQVIASRGFSPYLQRLEKL
jgi:small subunit ribosomal protein S1